MQIVVARATITRSTRRFVVEQRSHDAIALLM